MTTYSDSGVNVEIGNDASTIMYNAARETWKNRKGKLGEIVSPFEDFSGFRAVDISKLPEGTFLGMNFDGIGTKVEIAERLGKHDTMAFDLFAMVCDDAIMRGGEPALIGSILDVNKLEIGIVKQLAKGYVEAAKEANVAVINGEIAELGKRIGGMNEYAYNWGAGLVWFAQKKNLLTGKELKVGDKLVSFKEKGFRSNGFSLVRKIMENHWDKNTLLQALTPSKIYSKAVVEMFGKVSGVAHITGGGIPEKVGRMLRASGLGAKFEDLFEPCELMRTCMEIGKVSTEEVYKTWNMGNGMVVATRVPDEIIKIAKKNGIEAKVAGEIVKEKGVEYPELNY